MAERLAEARISEGVPPREASAECVAGTPQKRWLKPDEIAATVEFLVGEGASGINGEDITVDLGVTGINGEDITVDLGVPHCAT